ncbi:hypothetical protein [Vibrio campbellii]|uniref:DUF2541 family protein n=1 Tax=Vibrio campbellii TaxID=680 RepID=UPI00210A9DCA|nr:hypothetical protein [Vibrio campbellii]
MIKNLDDDLQQHSRIKVKVEKDNITDWRNFDYRRCVKNIKVYANSEGSKAGVRVYGKEKND